MSQTRMKPEARKEDILTAALIVATKFHYQHVSRAEIAEQAGVTGTTVQYHFHTMQQLRVQIMRAAIKRECLPVIAQGILAGDSHARKAPQELKDRAWSSIAGPKA